MKQDFRTLRLSTIAAAIALAFGASSVLAQQDQGRQPDPAQQPDRPQQSQQQGDQAQGDQARGAESSRDAQGGAALQELAASNGDISMFVEALQSAGLDNALTSGEYTLFAPTNEALESKDGQSLEELMAPENRSALLGFLRAHIVADSVDSDAAGRIQQAQTIDGGSVELASENGELKVGENQAVETDIQQGSLTVHVIDGVIDSAGQQSVARRDPEQQR